MARQIRWCMVCNLLTVSRRCPVCRKEVSKLNLDGRGDLVPMSPGVMKFIRSSVDGIFGDGCGNLLLPEGCVGFTDRTEKGSEIIVNGGKVGRITKNGLTLEPAGLKAISSKISKNYVRCNHDSSHFVKLGRNLMVTGVQEASSSLKKGDHVAMFDDRGNVIASGMMRMSSDEIAGSDRGVAVTTVTNVFARTCYGVQHHNWRKTLELNSSPIASISGTSVKDVKDLMSSYGKDVVVVFSGDIRSEASLLLTMEAGFRPKVYATKNDEFVKFMIEKHNLERIDKIPENCILICEDNVKRTSEIVVYSPIQDWDPSSFWLYVMNKSEPFHNSYINL